MKRWKSTSIWNSIKKHKEIFFEPQEVSSLSERLEYYYKSIDQGRGSLLLAVCRGKVSEGINFSDQYARGVLVVGIPFPSLKGDQVILKKLFNDKHAHSKQLLSGNQWYSQQAFRALNQALGRCIRHSLDYGAICIIGNVLSTSFNIFCEIKWYITLL